MDNEAFFKQAVESEKQGQIDLAATLYQRILENMPRHPGTLYNFATLNAKRNDFDQAILLFERMLDVEPDFAQAYYNVAICYMKKGDVRTAMTHLKNAVTLVPHYVEAQHLLGGILLRMDKFQEAEVHLKAALAANPDHPAVLCHMGIAYVHLGRMDDARENLIRSIALDSSLAEAHYHLGLVALKAGQIDEADTHFQSTIARDPQHFSAYYNLALIKKKQAQYKLAEHFIEKAYAIAPEHPFVAYLYGILNTSKAPTVTPPDYVASLFNEYAPYYDEHLTKVLNSDLPMTCLAVFKKVHDKPVNTTVDLGCGTGLCGAMFRDQTQRLIGVDLSEKMLDKARDKKIYDTLYQEDMLAMLRRAEHKIDLVLCCDALVYVGALEPFFEALKKALKEGGHALFTCEAGESPFALSIDGRFTHSEYYIRDCAMQHGFTINAFENTVLREQNGKPVMGYVVCVGY
ncbi:MAG: tetratricopeptide repeat protein [Gammaproteobacteria bacterium]